MVAAKLGRAKPKAALNHTAGKRSKESNWNYTADSCPCSLSNCQSLWPCEPSRLCWDLDPPDELPPAWDDAHARAVPLSPVPHDASVPLLTRLARARTHVTWSDGTRRLALVRSLHTHKPCGALCGLSSLRR
jgi:hypothetical protein